MVSHREDEKKKEQRKERDTGRKQGGSVVSPWGRWGSGGQESLKWEVKEQGRRTQEFLKKAFRTASEFSDEMMESKIILDGDDMHDYT